MKALFESINLIGDALYVGPALRQWIKNQKVDYLDVTIITLNDHVAPLYRGMLSDMMNSKFSSLSVVFDAIGDFDFRWKFDVGQAFKLSDDKKQHLAKSYADLLGVTLPDTGPKALKPIYIVDEDAVPVSEGLYESILISMFSMSCTSHDPKYNFVPNKCLPPKKWEMMLRELRNQFPVNPIRLLGAPTDKIPEELVPLCKELNIFTMFGIPLNTLAFIMKRAKFLVTIDNGMSHLAASQETPTFLLYPVCLGTHYILPIGNPNMVYVQMNPVHVNPAYLHQAMQFAIKKLIKEKR